MRLHKCLGLAAAVMMVACGSSSTAAHPTPSHSANPSSSAASSPTSSGAPFPSPAPVAGAVAPVTASCTSPPSAGNKLVLVNLRNVSGIIVRDITDIGHPANRCKLSGGSYFKFISATRLSYIVTASGDQGAAGALYIFDMATGATSLVRAWSYGGFGSWAYAWSPDGSHLTYIDSDSNQDMKWHLLSAAGDRLLADLGAVPARGANPDNDDLFVGFSADGQLVAVEQTFTPTPIRVHHVSDGSVAYTRTDGTMAAWAGSGARLYFRTSAGVQSWAPGGGVVAVSNGTAWIRPHASPDGSRMAFSLLNAQGNHIAEALDLTTASGAIQQLSPSPRVGPIFASASLVWYAGETICTTATPCGLGGPPLTGTTYIYDLGSGVEAGSIDTNFYDAWPHVVGQS
jgi:WD40 repeat protein